MLSKWYSAVKQKRPDQRKRLLDTFRTLQKEYSMRQTSSTIIVSISLAYLQVDIFSILTILDLNLVDWSANNVLAVALGSSVYLWNADTGSIDQLLELEGADYVCSLNWMQEGNLIAVGTSLGDVQVRMAKVPMYFEIYAFSNILFPVMGCHTSETSSRHVWSFCTCRISVLEFLHN